MAWTLEESIGRGTLTMVVVFWSMLLVAVGAAQANPIQDETGAGGTGNGKGEFDQYCPHKQYVKGVYMCLDFSNDFETNCKNGGSRAWTVILSFSGCGYAACSHLNGHAMGIAQGCPGATVFDRYCAVEPQTGAQWCWSQAAGPSVPTVPQWIQDQMFSQIGQNYANCVTLCHGNVIIQGRYKYTHGPFGDK